MEKMMSVGEVLKALQITHSTLRDWERKGILLGQKNQFGWRLFRTKDVAGIKLRIVSGRADGKKLTLHGRPMANSTRASMGKLKRDWKTQ